MLNKFITKIVFNILLKRFYSDSGSSSESEGSSKSRSGSDSDGKSTTTNASPTKINKKHTRVCSKFSLFTIAYLCYNFY